MCLKHPPSLNMLNLILISIFLVPLCGVIYNFHQPVWYTQYLGLLFFLFCGVGFYLKKLDKYLSVFYLICVFSTFFVTNLSPRAVILLVNFGICGLASYQVSKLSQTERKKVVYAILGLVILQGVLVFLQYFNLDPIFNSLSNPEKDDTVGFAGSKDFIGTFFALTLPISLSISPFLVLINIFGLVLSKSSFAFVAGFVAGLFYLFYTSRKLFYISLISTLICGFIFFLHCDKLHIADFQTRGNVWKYAIQSTFKGEIEIEKTKNNLVKIHSNSLLGFGFGNFQSIFPYVSRQTGFNYENEKFTHAHNDFIETFFELGWIGLIGIGLFLFGLIKGFVKSKETILYASCLIAVGLNCMGNFLFQNAVSGMLIVLFYGMYKGSLNGSDTV